MRTLTPRGKPDLKVRAIELRRQGNTYSEILKVIPVAKSTLSLWFHDVGLAEHQKQRITEKRIEGQKKGAAARRTQRIRKQEEIWSVAEREVGNISERDLWLIGVTLYWAEGSKEKDWRPGSKFIFSNSDPRMIRVVVAWLYKFASISSDEIGFELYLHESKRDDASIVMDFWSKETGFSVSRFNRVYFKRDKIGTKRKNIGLLYNGLIRVTIPNSSSLVRRMEGWARGISNNCRVV